MYNLPNGLAQKLKYVDNKNPDARAVGIKGELICVDGLVLWICTG